MSVIVKEGIINVRKPKGYTSHDCVNVIRSLSGVKRVGHTGTLDPMAEGVLPICIGSSARITEYLDLDFKTYRCECLLGIETDTLDVWGETTADNILETERLIKNGDLTEESLTAVLNKFQGTISQIPPKYSALKVNGRKLYEYARSGEAIEISSRMVYIDDLELKECSLENRTFSFDVTCSKGTYIRSICRDIGDMLGCGATMSGLTRTASGAFSIEDAVDIDELKKLKQGEDVRNPETGKIVQYARALPEELNEYIIEPDFPLVNFGKILLSEDRGRWFCNGGYVNKKQAKIVRKPKYEKQDAHIEMRDEFRRAYNAYVQNGEEELFLGVAFFDEERQSFKADKVFCRG